MKTTKGALRNMSILQKIEKLQEWEHIGVITITGNTNSSDLAEFLTTLKDEYCRENSDMKSEKIEVYGTESGKLYIKPEDLFAQKKIQDVIKKAAMKSKTENSDNAEENFYDAAVTGYKKLKEENEELKKMYANTHAKLRDLQKEHSDVKANLQRAYNGLENHKALKKENAALREAVKELLRYTLSHRNVINLSPEEAWEAWKESEQVEAAIEKARNLIK